MQIPTRQFAETQLRSMSSLQRELQDIQIQLSTGKKILHASDNPTASIEIARIDNQAAALARDKAALQFTNGRLGLEEDMLGEAISMGQRLKELAVLGNRQTTAQDRANLVAEARQLEGALEDLANTADESGHSLFAGFRTNVRAFAEDAATGNVTYQGDNGAVVVPGNEDTTHGVDHGGKLFGGVRTSSGLTDAFSIVGQFITALDSGTGIAAAQIKLDALSEHLNTKQTEIGAARSAIETRIGLFAGKESNLAARREPLAKPVIEELGTKLQQGIAALTAAQQSFIKTIDLNLFKFLT